MFTEGTPELHCKIPRGSFLFISGGVYPMKAISVAASVPYQVFIGAGLLDHIGEYIRRFVPDAETAFVVSDDTVCGLYGGRIGESLRLAGLRTCFFTVPHGEASKNAENYLRILERLSEERVTRSDVIAALGGGVVGDLAGFAAATYLRGIPFVQIPTTLLAQVDSSVGGKTAIDLPAGKNLAGAFYQPAAVICDPDTLGTLPEEIFADGCAEVIKYGLIGDRALFGHLKENGTGFDREYTIARCVEMKRDVVTEDEFDRGARQLLNYGHTVAHAAEKLSGYRLSHGRAVAAGMAVMARAAAENGICSRECAAETEDVLGLFGLPAETDYTADELYEAMLSDKKRKGDRISLVLPEEIGRCVIRDYTLEEMRLLTASGMRHAPERGR